MKQHLISQWRDICSNFKWRIVMQHHKMMKQGEFLDSHRTIVFENINLIISWFGSSGQIRYLNSKYPNINFCYPITFNEFKGLFDLYEGYSYEQIMEIEKLRDLKLKYPHE